MTSNTLTGALRHFFSETRLLDRNLLYTRENTYLSSFGHTVAYIPPPPRCDPILLFSFTHSLFVIGIQYLFGVTISTQLKSTHLSTSPGSSSMFSDLTRLWDWNLLFPRKYDHLD